MTALPLGQTLRASDDAGARNMLLLTHLRWLAILGQLAAIVAARIWVHVPLPLVPMAAILTSLVLLNLATLALLRSGAPITNGALFAALVVDWAALAGQLYLSGGATNPFAPIGLLQVVLGAVLLEAWSSWALLTLHSLAFGALAVFHDPLDLPPPYASTLAPVHIFASWLNFTLAAVLLVSFVTRISRNLRLRDARLAELRQHAAEEDHIVRMGLLASGAAHELGTPLSSIAVILGDWRKQPALAKNTAMAEDMAEMQTAVARCKEIVTGILYASGEARSEGVEKTSLSIFLGDVVAASAELRPDLVTLEDHLPRPIAIVADRTLAQVLLNLLDNAADAGATRVTLRADLDGEMLILSVRDDGPGFAPDVLPTLGQPYVSTKDRRGAGLGLFLAVNVLRKLGGAVTAANAPEGGAVVTLTLPVEALKLEQNNG